MDEQNVNTTEMAPEIDTTAEHVPEENLMEKHHTHMGPVLGALIVALVLILVGFYLWGSQLSKNAELIDTMPAPTPVPFQNTEPETPRDAADAQTLETVSSSDEISAIEADLESTNLDTLTDGLDQAERELDAGLQ